MSVEDLHIISLLFGKGFDLKGLDKLWSMRLEKIENKIYANLRSRRSQSVDWMLRYDINSSMQSLIDRPTSRRIIKFFDDFCASDITKFASDLRLRDGSDKGGRGEAKWHYSILLHIMIDLMRKDGLCDSAITRYIFSDLTDDRRLELFGYLISPAAFRNWISKMRKVEAQEGYDRFHKQQQLRGIPPAPKPEP